MTLGKIDMKSAEEVIGIEEIRKLREAGFVVIHQKPTNSMKKAFFSAAGRTEGSVIDGFHRLVAESIRLQNEA